MLSEAEAIAIRGRTIPIDPAIVGDPDAILEALIAAAGESYQRVTTNTTPLPPAPPAPEFDTEF